MSHGLDASLMQRLRVLVQFLHLEVPFAEEARLVDPQPLVALAHDLGQSHLLVSLAIDVSLTLPVAEHIVQFADLQILGVTIYALLVGEDTLLQQVTHGEHGSLDRLGAVLLLELRILPASSRRQLLLARLPAVR